VVGLQFISRILLATIYDNYKRRMENRAENKSEQRITTIKSYFKLYDKNDSGVLDIEQAKKFFALIFDLNYKESNDRTMFRKIMTVVDVDNSKTVKLENVIEFF
jgi:Ca2+-binding EF-hand superfamily protein